jgi:hypothetical protein
MTAKWYSVNVDRVYVLILHNKENVRATEQIQRLGEANGVQREA